MPPAERPNLTFFCDDQGHLVCQPFSVENLHLMAAYFGIKRHWFHGLKKGHPHYDIPRHRFTEIHGKCIILSPREVLAICKVKA